jgi:hypothetical protein
VNRDDFRYADLVEEVRQRLPSLRGALDQFVEQWSGEELPMHLAFSEVIYEGLSAAASRGPAELDEVAVPLFAFIERMALHPDSNVRNVAYVSLCEPLCANEALLQKSRKYMGSETRRFCDRIIKGAR